MARPKQTTQVPIETQLCKAAEKLGKNIDATEYERVLLGLVFLKYISDAFKELYEKLTNAEFTDHGDPEEYKTESVFFAHQAPAGMRINPLRAKRTMRGSGADSLEIFFTSSLLSFQN